MRLHPFMRAVAGRLPLRKHSEHFSLCYGLRNPAEGEGMGAMGVGDDALLSTYLEVLEKTYKVLTAPPWSRKPPAVDGDRKTVVYVFDLSELLPAHPTPFTFPDLDDIPFIGLRSGSREPTLAAELSLAAAEAVHETVHVFNYGKRPIRDHYRESWRWFDEGMTVLLEAQVLADNSEYLRFMADWINLPHVPLDDASMAYQSSSFLCYLMRRVRCSLNNEAWVESGSTEKPFETLERLLGRGVSPHALPRTIGDVFFDYCVDSYFLADHVKGCLTHNAYVRFGGRAVARSFSLSAGEPAHSVEGTLDHLACRYYRLYLKGEVGRVRVELLAESPGGTPPLRAALSAVMAGGRRGAGLALRGGTQTRAGDSTSLSAELTDLDGEVDHLLLTVGNCGQRSSKLDLMLPHDDNQKYAINVSAHHR